mgnify:CR=1 FL=1
MKKELNISEILKGKPKGIRLYSPIFGDCTFSFIQGVTDAICVIINNNREFFDYKGLFSTLGEVMLFPSKEMRDWSKFAWKKGDVLVSNSGKVKVIFDKFRSNTYLSFIGKYHIDSLECNNPYYQHEGEYATGNFKLEEVDAAQTYINTIEERLDGKLNRETLEIEKALSFKDGDILSIQEDKEHYHTIFILKGGTDVYVFFDYFHRVLTYGTKIDENEKSICRLATEDEKKVLFDALAKEGKVWDAEKKMIVDLKSLWTPKPFERVITRNAADDVWTANIFSHMDSHGEYVTIACVGGYTYCIPYNEETAKLIGTTKDVEG